MSSGSRARETGALNTSAGNGALEHATVRRSLVSVMPVPAPLPEGTVPRISRLMALAIHFDRLLASGAVGSMTELARRYRVTRARMSQIMNLNHLAPEIQEGLLFLPRTATGRARITERDLRAISAEVDWGRQCAMAECLTSGTTSQA